MITSDLPLVVIGAGPIGLAAAAQAVERGLATVVLESGDRVAAAVRTWGHVRTFSPWSELVDPAAARLLAEAGWTSPDLTASPTGAEWATLHLQPLADALTASGLVDLRLGHRVTGVARQRRDRVVDDGREHAPYVVHTRTALGRARLLAGAVVDASGTWLTPSPLGGDGYPADGEDTYADRLHHGAPDLDDPTVRQRFTGRHVVVAGSGATAHHALVGLSALDGTTVSWLVRRERADAFGGGDADELPRRGALGQSARRAVEGGTVRTVTGFRTAALQEAPDGTLVVQGEDGRQVAGVDEVVVATGYRPDHSFLAEVRLDLDGELGAPRALAPGIHPAHHSCGTVSPHGAALLAQPDAGLYLVGAKSYGRAPSFLALTGFEQVRSAVAELAGDHEAAARVELVLPETGVCGGTAAYDGGGCCAPDPAPLLPLLGRGGAPVALQV